MPRKIITIEDVRKEATRRKYILVSDKYTHGDTKMEFVCPNGHRYMSSWNNFRRGKGCRTGICNKHRRTIEDISAEFNKYGYEVLESKYTRMIKPLKVKCPRGHILEIVPLGFIHGGKRCRICYEEDVYITIEHVRSEFEKEGYTLVSKEYANNHTYLDYICDRGHKNKTKWGTFHNGARCPECRQEDRIIDESVIKDGLKEFGYGLVPGTYTMAKEPFIAVCDKGHEYKTYWYNFKKGNRCGVCDVEKKTSKPEKEVLDFISSIYSGSTLENVRSVISPYELDIYLPRKNLAIEYCGLYWHSDLYGKDKGYHLNKYNMCLDKNIRLITIFGDEYNNDREAVFSKLKKVVSNHKTPLFSTRGDRLISDLRWDWHCSAHYYEKMGYVLNKETGPSLYKTIETTKHKNTVYGNVWDCGSLIYKKKCQ